MSLIFCDSDPLYDRLLENAAQRQTTTHLPGTVWANSHAIGTFVAFSSYFNIDYTRLGVDHILAYIEYLAQHFKSPQSVKNILITYCYEKGRWFCPVATYKAMVQALPTTHQDQPLFVHKQIKTVNHSQ